MGVKHSITNLLLVMLTAKFCMVAISFTSDEVVAR